MVPNCGRRTPKRALTDEGKSETGGSGRVGISWAGGYFHHVMVTPSLSAENRPKKEKAFLSVLRFASIS